MDNTNNNKNNNDGSIINSSNGSIYIDRGRVRWYMNDDTSFYRSWVERSLDLTLFGPANETNPVYTQLGIDILRAQRRMRLDSPGINPRVFLRVYPQYSERYTMGSFISAYSNQAIKYLECKKNDCIFAFSDVQNRLTHLLFSLN